jgi:hypothetical protein
MAKGSSRDEDKESFLEILGVFAVFILTMGFLIWIFVSHKIVWGTLKPALFLGSVWKLGGFEFGILQWNSIVNDVRAMSVNPGKVSFISWAHLVNVSMRPIIVLACLFFAAFILTFRLRGVPFTRRFSTSQLMQEHYKIFSGIAPVIAIRKKIAQNTHPLWRLQVSPDEVFLNYRVPKSPHRMTLASAGAPMIQDAVFNLEVARDYFTDIKGHLEGGRLMSGMLGRQVVNLVVDAGKQQQVVFADRLSSEGKAVLALWAAVAFGGPTGRDEFCKYRDKLNWSAFGTADGKANLTVVQPLYNKYRNHPELNKIFAIHHWEHTVLYALLGLAQKKGRFTTAEVLWLRPTNRVMYFALNTCGANTPHTEAAATFSQRVYEQMCARQKRLPLVRNDKGELMHVIFTSKIVDGLALEARRWNEALDDGDDDWWMKQNLWVSADAMSRASMTAAMSVLPAGPMPGETSASAAFDAQMTQQAQIKAREEEARLNRAIASVNSGNADLDSLFNPS